MCLFYGAEDELGFLEDKLRAVSMELKAFRATRRRRMSFKGMMDSMDSLPALEIEASIDRSAAAPSAAMMAGDAEEKAISSQVGPILRFCSCCLDVPSRRISRLPRPSDTSLSSLPVPLALLYPLRLPSFLAPFSPSISARDREGGTIEGATTCLLSFRSCTGRRLFAASREDSAAPSRYFG